MLLETEGLTKRFGGITAVDGVDFALETGELCSIIGPNGAGKTTFFNLLTGVLEPSDGTIRFDPGGGDASAGGAGTDGTDSAFDITAAAPDETALAGIHRSYQITNLFPTLTVLENVRIAAQASRGNDSWKLWRNVTEFDDHRAVFEDQFYAFRSGVVREVCRAGQVEYCQVGCRPGAERSGSVRGVERACPVCCRAQYRSVRGHPHPETGERDDEPRVVDETARIQVRAERHRRARGLERVGVGVGLPE